MAGVGDLHLERLHPTPQLRQPVLEVQCVGDQLPSGVRRHLQPGAEVGRAELGHQRCPGAPVGDRTLATVQIATVGVECVLVVQDRELHRQLEHLSLGAPLGRMQDIEPVEQRALIQLVNAVDHLHGPSLAETTDKNPFENAAPPQRGGRVRGASRAFHVRPRHLRWRAC
jgi:hypothetical protein